MGRPCKDLQLSPSHLRDLEELSVQAKTLGSCDVVLRIRGLVMVARRHSYREVAACLGVTSGSVSNWIGNFERQGYEGLLTRPHPGRPAELSEEELLLLDDLVDAGAAASGFPNDLWDARRVAAIIRAHFGISYHPHHVAKLLRGGDSVCKSPSDCWLWLMLPSSIGGKPKPSARSSLAQSRRPLPSSLKMR